MSQPTHFFSITSKAIWHLVKRLRLYDKIIHDENERSPPDILPCRHQCQQAQ